MFPNFLGKFFPVLLTHFLFLVERLATRDHRLILAQAALGVEDCWPLAAQQTRQAIPQAGVEKAAVCRVGQTVVVAEPLGQSGGRTLESIFFSGRTTFPEENSYKYVVSKILSLH